MPQETNSTSRKPTVMENVKTVNSVVRTSMMAAILGCVGYGGYFGYNNYIKPSAEAKQAMVDLAEYKEKFAEQEEALKETAEKNAKLQTAMKLLKIDRRVAHLKVLEKGIDENGEEFLKVRFTEVDGAGEVIGSPRDYTLLGKMFFIDCLIVKFKDEYIEQADALREASMFTFKSIYGDAQKPQDGFPLDIETGDKAPGIYGNTERTRFEEKIWNDFWTISNDAHQQDELGIRAIHGQANYLPPEEGRTYEITIRSSGGVGLKALPVDEP